MALKMILNDGTEIELNESSGTTHAVVSCATREDFIDAWDALIAEGNLEEVRYVSGDDELYTIANMRLSGTQAVYNGDGSITGHFYFISGTVVRDDFAEAGRILMGEED